MISIILMVIAGLLVVLGLITVLTFAIGFVKISHVWACLFGDGHNDRSL